MSVTDVLHWIKWSDNAENEGTENEDMIKKRLHISVV